MLAAWGSELNDAARPARGTDEQGWNLAEGEEIVPGRTAVRLLGSSRVHDVYAAWDETILGIVAVKMLRPASVDDERARRALGCGSRRRSSACPTRRSPGASTQPSTATDPHLVLELVEGPRLST